MTELFYNRCPYYIKRSETLFPPPPLVLTPCSRKPSMRKSKQRRSIKSFTTGNIKNAKTFTSTLSLSRSLSSPVFNLVSLYLNGYFTEKLVC